MRTLTHCFRPAVVLSLLAASLLGVLDQEGRAQTFDTVLNTNLFQPAGISVNPLNHYFIADTAHHRVIDFNADNRNFVVLAGPDIAPFDPGAVDGQGIDARFRNPQGILCVGDVTYIADSGNHVIRQIDNKGRVQTIAGNLAVAHEVDDFGGSPMNWGFTDGPAATAQFNGPSGLAIDGTNRLYIADSGNHAIRMLDLNSGTVSTVVRSGLTTPVSLAITPGGTLFISDTGAHSIKVWHPGDTRAALVAGGGNSLARGFRNSAIATNALFSGPAGIFYRESSDELIVADSGNGVLRTVVNVSGTAPGVQTFANTGAAGYQTPIAVTRDLYGVFLVCDSTRNTLASVITVKFPRIDKPQVGYIDIYIDQQTGLPVAHLIPVTDQIFENLVKIAVSGDATAQHYFSVSSTLTNSLDLPIPTTNSISAPNFVQPVEPAPPDNVLTSESINGILPPSFNFHLKVFSASKGIDERIPSLVTEAFFRFKCASPQIDSQSVPGRLVFHCATTNAVMYYTMDGSDPAQANNSATLVKNGDSIPLVVTTNTVLIKARSFYASRFMPSEMTQVTFSPDNFIPNRISIGFSDGEASSRMRAAPGQRYFAPVTLSLMPSAKAYGLQFDLSLEPLSAPVATDYKMRFTSSFIEQSDFTNRIIPPSVYVLTGTNFVTNLVNTIATNYTYEITLTNLSATPSTNYVSFTNKLDDVVPVITTRFVTNLGTIFPITSTNYVTNSFQLVSGGAITNTTTDIETNFLYRYASPSITNLVRVDSRLDDSTPVVLTNFVSNLGQLFSYNVTNYLTNSFNLISSGNVTNVTVSVQTNYAYQAVSPALTNLLSLGQEVPPDAEIIVTNFVSNLGQLFPVVVTNRLTNAFTLLSSGSITNNTSTVETNFTYRAVSAGITDYISWNSVLLDHTPVVLTNFVTNLGALFPVTTTNFLTNEFNFVSSGYVTNISRFFTTNYLYEFATPARTNFVEVDHPVESSVPLLTTNFVANVGQQFAVVTTNYVSNSFDLFSSELLTNRISAVTTNFEYRAVSPGITNYIASSGLLLDKTPIILTNFVDNLGQLFPIATTNYISNAFNLVSFSIDTNRVVGTTTNYQYEVVTPGSTNLVVLDHYLVDKSTVLTTNFVSNLGQQFPVVTTNYISNSFNLLGIDVVTNVDATVITNYAYRTITPGTTTLITVGTLLPPTIPVVVTNFLSNLGQQFPVVQTNYLTNAFDFVSSAISTNVVSNVSTSFVYRYFARGTSNYFTFDHFLPDFGPVVTAISATNQGQSYVMTTTNLAQNVFQFVSAQISTNVVSALSYEYVYNTLPWTNYLLWPGPLADNTTVITTNSFIVTNQTTGAVFKSPVYTTNSVTSADLSQLLLQDGDIEYLYAIPSTLPASKLVSSTPLSFPASIAIQDTGYIPELNETFTEQFVTIFANPIVSTNTNTLVSVQITTNAVYRIRTPDLVSYTTLATNIPDVSPVVSQVTLTNLGQNFTFAVTNYATNVFDLLSTTYTTNSLTSVTTNSVYALRSPAVTNIINLSTNLPDLAPVITTTFVTNLGQPFPVRTTNYVANTFEFLGGSVTTNVQTSVVTNVNYMFANPPITNYVFWPDILPDSEVVFTTNFVINLGRQFPIVTTSFITNNFRLVGSAVQTNYAPGISTNALYAFITPGLTNHLSLTNKLLDLAPVVTTTFLTNQGQLFPIFATNYVANSFDFLGESHSTNSQVTVRTNITYVFVDPAVTNYILWPDLLPPTQAVLTTNFVSNLGQLFPVTVTNYLSNAFRLISDAYVTTNETRSVSTNVLYAFTTPNLTNYLTLAEKLPASREVITTNFISNLGQLYPVSVTNIVFNTFDLVSTNVLTNTASTVTADWLYALTSPSETNRVYWPIKLPDSVTLVSTNFITNLGQLFPVLSTNIVANQFRFLFTNYLTNIAVNVRTNDFYEFHTPAVTNYFELDEKLPAFVQVISTNFVTNLGRLFPVLTTNLTVNIFDLLSTNVSTNQTVDISSNFLYEVLIPGGGADGKVSIVTNQITMGSELPNIVPIVNFVGFATNLNQVYSVFVTNYLQNTFKLVGTGFITNTFQVALTNVPDAFTDLVITNYSQNWLAVGWVETYGRTNLYNTIQHDLLQLSMAHETTFQSKNGEAVAGSFSFLVPTNAATGDTYQLQVSRPSATADGISQDMFIEAPDDSDVKSPVKAIKTLTVTNRLGYVVGDVSDFRWFNAGEFGDGNLLNNDITELQRVIVYGLNVPPEDSDFLDAMDTCCYTEEGQDLSNIEFASSSIDLNRVAFGEGSRYAPLGRRPSAVLAVNDLYVAYRRSLDPTLNWYQRYWSNGMRQATIISNTFRSNGTSALADSRVTAKSLPSGQGSQSTQSPALTVYAGTASGLPGKVVAVPIHVRVDGGYPLRTLMFNARVEATDGTVVAASSLEVAASDALGQPAVLLNDAPGRSGVAWLDTSTAGVFGDQVVGRLLFTIPDDAQPMTLFYVKLDNVSGSPNGVSLFPVRSGNGVIAMANRPPSIWNDGIPDSWRLQYFGSLNDIRSAADADADGDGLSNYEEYKLGTNPLDPTDSLRVHASSNGRGVKIRFHTASGKLYQVEGSSNLQPGSWTAVQNNVAGTGNDIELPASGGAHYFYYRVRLQE